MPTSSSVRVVFALLFFWSSLASAQTVTGTITGTVTDSSGGVAPNVTVTATELATNLRHTTRTTVAGVYTLNFLPVGDYTITAEAKGFKISSLGPVRLDVNQTVREDIQLVVGQISEKVEVTATAAMLQTENAQTGDVISGQQATELPLNGRNFVWLRRRGRPAVAEYHASLVRRSGPVRRLRVAELYGKGAGARAPASRRGSGDPPSVACRCPPG